jgi:ribA/ribD-fused uncharacterized protein
MEYNNKWVQDKFDRNEKLDYLFFWGHTQKGSAIDKSCLSQWFYAPFAHPFEHEITFQTAEHFMMYKKAIVFNDMQAAEDILKAQTPKEAKAIGRRVKGFNDEVWNEVSFNMVVNVNLCKFMENEHLKEFLLNTGDKIIIEASPYDKVWGIGMSVANPTVENPHTWLGQNKLGYALMKTRDLIRS